MSDVVCSSDELSLPSGNKSTPSEKSISRVGMKKKPVQLKSSLGLLGCLVNIAKYVIIGIISLFVQKSGINWFLQLFGLSLKPLNMNNKGEKRKHSEVDNKEGDDEKTPEDLEEMEMKRWRPDHVYEAINEFVKKMWGEKDTNENIKEEDPTGAGNDENMNKFGSVHDGKWNKKPDVNFVAKKAPGIKTVGEGDTSVIRDLTPKKTDMGSIDAGNPTVSKEKKKVECDENESVDEIENGEHGGLGNKRILLDVVEETYVQTSTPLIESKTPEVFVFSAEKSYSSKTAQDNPEDKQFSSSKTAEEDSPADEQSMLSLMTFGEKQVYFAEQIKAQEAAAQMAAQRSPLPSPRPTIA